ncbi:transcriptional regulatory protein ZraR [bacterium BMS3Abin14]|nr:transcriptional regulatory protein ZraR [bacterium BMS3Abin14]
MSRRKTGGLILVVDDDKRVRESISTILQDEGFSVLEAADGESALTRVAVDSPDAVLLDVWMPGMDGVETLRGMARQDPELPVIIMSGHGNIETAVTATKLGAFDFLEKPLSIDRLTLALRNAISQRELVEENRALRDAQGRTGELVNKSPVMKAIIEQLRIVAPTMASVLITGDNGTGKELLARALHSASHRGKEPFVAVNCAAIPEGLIESELFGYERGAFTGANARKMGKFDLANHGTLFLDEIGDMSLATQAKILRVLEEKLFQRVGGNRDVEVDVRIVAATNKDLGLEISQGRFREDLFFRLNVFPFHIPPLRERKEDIPELLKSFLLELGDLYSKKRLSFSKEALVMMSSYSWPGNIRELRNVVERLVILSPDEVISVGLIPVSIKQGNLRKDAGEAAQEGDYRKAREDFERKFFLESLERNGWNVSKTAEEVGIERSNLHRKIKQFGLRK